MHIALDCGLFALVQASGMWHFSNNFWNSIPVNSPPGSCMHCWGHGYHASQRCAYFLWFLSSSGNLRLCITTITDVLYEPANVFTMLLWDVLHVLQFWDKHFLLIKVVVEPESNKTFSNLFDLTADIVSTTIIVIGARSVFLGSILI